MVSWSQTELLAHSHSPKLTTREAVQEDVDTWIKQLKKNHIQSIICLLDTDELDMFYGILPGGLLNYYRNNGFEVKHVPAKDYQSPALNSGELEKTWHAFSSLPKPVLIHCRQGISRTGHAIDYVTNRMQNKETTPVGQIKSMQIAQTLLGFSFFSFLAKMFL